MFVVVACATILLGTNCFGAPAGREISKLDDVRVVAGFRVELVYAPPLSSEGSWVSITVDDRGRLLASDQYGGIYRIEPSPLGGPHTVTRVTRVPLDIGSAQGMAFADGSLNVMVNSQEGERRSGLYRVSDTNGDDEFDSVQSLLPMQGVGEHGPHAVVESPDGKSLFICAGNYSPSPRLTASRVPKGWGEDQLLPRLNDPVGQGTGVPAPGGWIVRVNLLATESELFSVGYRNIYDLAFNADGELFTFESDLDVDLGTPWYRPPSVLHVVSGADYGWRGGDGLWRPSYPETLPPVATAPPGSPTGLVFGTCSGFPPRYQDALFAGDWSQGLIYAVFLTPVGASYRGRVETVAEGVAGVTDMVVRPQDGSLYFTVGGRKTQSGLYRLVWDRDDHSLASAPVAGGVQADALVPDPEAPAARDARRQLEEFHAVLPPNADLRIWPSLSNADRSIRYAALTALERTDSLFWSTVALKEPNPLARFTALIALSRQGELTQPDAWVDAFRDVRFRELDAQTQMTVVRAAAQGVMRFKDLSPPRLERLRGQAASWYPSVDDEVNRELTKLLVRLEAEAIIEPLLQQIKDDGDSIGAMDAAVTLSAMTTGWTQESRNELLNWFDAAAMQHGNRSYYPYLAAARERFVAGFSADERATFAGRLGPPPPPAGATEAPTTRPFVRKWTAAEVTEIVAAAEQNEVQGDAIKGRRIYNALQCAACHAMSGEGVSVGPDLKNLRGRYSIADLARAIVEPNREIPDLYRQTEFVVNGRRVIGRVTNMNATTLYVTTDMRDPGSATKVQRAEIEAQRPSATSAMPDNLLDSLSRDEIVDLFRYLRAPVMSAAGPRSPALAQP